MNLILEGLSVRCLESKIWRVKFQCLRFKRVYYALIDVANIYTICNEFDSESKQTWFKALATRKYNTMQTYVSPLRSSMEGIELSSFSMILCLNLRGSTNTRLTKILIPCVFFNDKQNPEYFKYYWKFLKMDYKLI